MAVLLRIQWLERVSCPGKVAAYLLYVALDLIGIQAPRIGQWYGSPRPDPLPCEAVRQHLIDLRDFACGPPCLWCQIMWRSKEYVYGAEVVPKVPDFMPRATSH